MPFYKIVLNLHGPIRRSTVKKNYISTVVSEILHYGRNKLTTLNCQHKINFLENWYISKLLTLNKNFTFNFIFFL